MPLPRKPQKERRSSKEGPRQALPQRKALSDKDLEGLDEKIRECVKWLPRNFQSQAIKGQLNLRDVVCHSGTGSGKTAIVAGPHFHPSSEGKVTLLVSPLIALHDEQVSHRQSLLGINQAYQDEC